MTSIVFNTGQDSIGFHDLDCDTLFLDEDSALCVKVNSLSWVQLAQDSKLNTYICNTDTEGEPKSTLRQLYEEIFSPEFRSSLEIAAVISGTYFLISVLGTLASGQSL